MESYKKDRFKDLGIQDEDLLELSNKEILKVSDNLILDLIEDTDKVRVYSYSNSSGTAYAYFEVNDKEYKVYYNNDLLEKGYINV